MDCISAADNVNFIDTKQENQYSICSDNAAGLWENVYNVYIASRLTTAGGERHPQAGTDALAAQ